ncbi:amidohydrolase family protein [Halococcus sp. AFM35]|uniref:amidohydrolase family protein n=1 Tax=Halococcus sp. AFM35 TaxID=3421653 RepID=UPI003EB74571
MDSSLELLVRNAYVSDRDAVVDIGVNDGNIVAIHPEITESGATELDAEGNLVSPGLVDGHVHFDMARSATGDRRPRNNDDRSERTDTIERTAAYFATTDRETIAANARRAAEQAIANGVLHIRSHGYVDSVVGTDVVETLASVREAFADRLDVEIVAFPQRGICRDAGSADAVRAALNTGADLVGGLDPATLNDDREATIATWFDVATEADADLDIHIHERGDVGIDTLTRLAAETIAHGYEGHVTASHAYALADAVNGSTENGRLGDAMEEFAAARLKFITCYQSTPPGMPIRRFQDAGLGMAHGTDQIHDLWGVHGNVDALEALLVESFKLDGYSTNQGLASLWSLVTDRAAQLLGIDGYGIAEGTPADLVVHRSASPEWAIVENRTPRYAVKEGRIVAEDGNTIAP